MRAATGAMVATSSGLAMIGLVLPLGMQEQKPGSGIDQRLSGHNTPVYTIEAAKANGTAKRAGPGVMIATMTWACHAASLAGWWLRR